LPPSQRIRRPCVLPQRVHPGLEEGADEALNAAQDLGHVIVRESGKRHDADGTSFADWLMLMKPPAPGDLAVAHPHRRE
jgi:hypothetical protein